MSQEYEIKRPFSRGCLTRSCSLRNLYLRETTQKEYLQKQLQKMQKEIFSYQRAINMLLSGLRTAIDPDHIALRKLADGLKKIGNVLGLYYTVRQDVIYLWIIEKEDDVDSELAISQELSNIFSTFDNLRFDFSILTQDAIKTEEFLLSDSQLVFSRQKGV